MKKVSAVDHLLDGMREDTREQDDFSDGVDDVDDMGAGATQHRRRSNAVERKRAYLVHRWMLIERAAMLLTDDRLRDVYDHGILQGTWDAVCKKVGSAV